VYVDDVDTTPDMRGGKAYSSYGIDPEVGAIVVVRPDGYVGAVAPLQNFSDIYAYFAVFMNMKSLL
jgi:phenol 2-monooxygenase (NADPH)